MRPYYKITMELSADYTSPNFMVRTRVQEFGIQPGDTPRELCRDIYLRPEDLFEESIIERQLHFAADDLVRFLKSEREKQERKDEFRKDPEGIINALIKFRK